MKRVVYVTGCFGFIGSYVTRACLAKGWYVRGVDSQTYAANTKGCDFWDHPNFDYDVMDINDIEHL